MYILHAHQAITDEYLHTVGVFSSETAALNAMSKRDRSLTFKLEIFTLDVPKHGIDTEPPVLPSYVINAIKEAAKQQELNHAINTVTEKSINKILQEILECVDNPEVVKEYIQGLKDNLEDYL